MLHVVQKYSSGVGSAIAQYTRSLPEVEHHLVSGTAVDAEGDLADQADFASARLMTGGHLAKVRQVRDAIHDLRPDVVHAHSSHGGLYARLATRRGSHNLVYTPHCYAFERRDITAPVRGAFWLAEAVLAMNTSAFAACSPREWQLSAWPTRSAPRHLVPNIAPEGGPRRRPRRSGSPLVAGGGRLSPQKDPAFFLAAVQALRLIHPDLRGVWLGDGEQAHARELEAAGVGVSGWLPRSDALALLAEADLYLHSARWEGFPLMVAEAAAIGVPTLVRRLPSFSEVPPFLTIGDLEDLSMASACVADPEVAAENVAGWTAVLRHNTVADQRAALAGVYGGLLPAGAAPARVSTRG